MKALGLERCLVLIILLSLCSAKAEDLTRNLYQCKAIVTGTDAERRAPTMIDCFRRTMAKVSGDQRLLDDRSISLTIEQVVAAVDTLTLRDRLWRQPIHDEQGTRDRPHDLTVDFKHSEIDAALDKVGRRPWLGHRPSTAVLVLVRHGGEPFILSSDGERGPGMSEALLNAAESIGLPGTAPTRQDLRSAGVDVAQAAHPSSKDLRALEKSMGAEASLTGILTWSDEALGWIADWTLIWKGETANWNARGVNFDEAFRVGFRGAAQIISGNGRP